MTPERFRTLVDTYGANARRWPEGERADAEVWAEAHRAQAQIWLDQASQLDLWLAQDQVAPPSRALIERVVAQAPGPRTMGWQFGLWWPGAACAGAGLIGGVVGAFAVSLLLLGGASSGARDPAYMTTGFGHAGSDWSLDGAAKLSASGGDGRHGNAGDNATLSGNEDAP